MNKYQVTFRGEKSLDAVSYLLKIHFRGMLVGEVRHNTDDGNSATLLFQRKRYEWDPKDEVYDGVMVSLFESHKVITVDIASVGSDELNHISPDDKKGYVVYDRIKLDMISEIEKMGFNEIEILEYTDEE